MRVARLFPLALVAAVAAVGMVAMVAVVQTADLAALAAMLPDADTSTPYVAHLDAIVADRSGRLLRDLRAEDFEVFEDGVPRPIDSVRLVSVDQPRGPDETLAPIVTRADEQAAGKRDGARLFAIFWDEF